jgi:predicted RNase H-like nuclease (RuvC/YqgF family)
MDNNADIVTRLRGKMQQLVWLYEREQNKVKQLGEQIALLEKALSERDSVIEDLEDKNKNLKLAAAFKSGSTDANEAKIRIGKIVREIDKCVALLNK